MELAEKTLIFIFTNVSTSDSGFFYIAILLRWFSLIRIKSLIQIKCCSVNARMGAKPVLLRINSASVNGVIKTFLTLSFQISLSWWNVLLFTYKQFLTLRVRFQIVQLKE